jgi:ABC-type multidrug transport system fused ATPase/permease subunit
MRFDELREIRAVGKRVLLNNELFLKVGSNTLATSIARRIEHLRKLPSRQRDAAIGTMCRETLDSEAIERRWAEFRANAGSLRLLGNILVVFVFVFAPVVIWNLGFKLTWLGLLIGLLCLTTTTAFLFRRAHGRLFAKAEDERFTHTLTILLSPATAMRAHDVLSRPLLETFHPLAVAQVFLRKERFRPFARRLLLDIRHPAPPVFPTNDPVACSADRSWRAAMQAAMEDSLKRHGCNPEELCRPPLPLDQSCCAFCPRCEAQFTTSSARCADCGGLPVVAFSAP